MQYTLRRVWWDERKEAKEAYSDKVVAYVNRLDVDEDIAFLKSTLWCGGGGYFAHKSFFIFI